MRRDVKHRNPTRCRHLRIMGITIVTRLKIKTKE
jgi:hypothetical protein